MAWQQWKKIVDFARLFLVLACKVKLKKADWYFEFVFIQIYKDFATWDSGIWPRSSHCQVETAAPLHPQNQCGLKNSTLFIYYITCLLDYVLKQGVRFGTRPSSDLLIVRSKCPGLPFSATVVAYPQMHAERFCCPEHCTPTVGNSCWVSSPFTGTDRWHWATEAQRQSDEHSIQASTLLSTGAGSFGPRPAQQVPTCDKVWQWGCWCKKWRVSFPSELIMFLFLFWLSSSFPSTVWDTSSCLLQ